MGPVHHVSMKHNTAILISSGTSRWLKIALRDDWEAARSNIAIVFDAHFSRGLPRRLRRWISTVKSKCRRNSISLGIHSINSEDNLWADLMTRWGAPIPVSDLHDNPTIKVM